ncbi:CDP-6-deoxy-L-threo-D-glycero-4-hexulose-3-dehydrase reductase [Marinomonas spartinae]|uniref:CDP-6-deoxy-L-threo-D-glycero-4-hexulose-3-dehydrase reductase n=1 Tax=Marinomonas spartinae TaxID=1792290 RepID=A0A1A8TVX7_9GAMM|nr:2Fe-2S iron-sulfur cluster-binding protein [Marinomonas spartinae]SBS29202.1 CDP-6-deoxy-L-threo-D-glycero-4-hexulose-3-dehydrase reductase [Marinomonas spartinae]SBS37615.1 CDP-6-deoxy-L-threo-D-glycero-4-hexulose-3-dehydrase reductase [Marinomonas spartinae]
MNMNNKRISLQQGTSEKHFPATEESILEVLIAHSVPIKHACQNGTCGICLTPLITGEIDYGSRQPRGLSDKEQAAGYFLPCIAKCKTDIRIGPPKVKVHR